MLLDVLNSIGNSIVNNNINLVFTIIIIIVFLIGFLFKSSAFNSNALMSIGILGTFTGIFYSLSYFDTNNIDKSVPPLLEGMKTAFVTSLLGMFFGIIIKITPNFSKGTKTNISSGDFYKIMSDIKESIKTDSISKEIAQINKAIIGDNETSIATNLSKIRSDANDNSKELIKEFKLFSEEMTKNNMEALIEAIQKVMNDFNTKINDNLGDKFKELNKSVENLVLWQENNKEELARLMQAQKASAEALKKSQDSLKVIENSSKSIPDIFNKTLSVSSKLEAQLKAFEKLKENAVSAFPIIQKNIDDLTSNFSKSSDKAAKEIEKSYKIIGDVAKTTKTSISNFSEHLESITDQLNSTIASVFKKVDNQLDDTLRKTSESLHTQISKLDEQMQDEMKKALEIMGGHLASISNRFVQDYTPLTDKLKEVINIAKKVA